MPDSPFDPNVFRERYLAAWNGCDTGLIAELITEDIVWRDPALPEPAVGVPAVQEFMRTSFRAMPDLRFADSDPAHLSVAGDQIAWAWTMQGTMSGAIDPPGFAPSGARVQIDGVDLWTMRDGRIARYRAFYDLTELLRQLGIMPQPGSPAERLSVALQRLKVRLQRRS